MTSDNIDQSFRNVLAALTSRDQGLSGDIDMFLRSRMFLLYIIKFANVIVTIPNQVVAEDDVYQLSLNIMSFMIWFPHGASNGSVSMLSYLNFLLLFHNPMLLA